MNSKKTAQAIVTVPPLYLARANAAAFLSISETTLDALVAKGEVAKPRKLTQGRSAWLLQDLVDWGVSRPVSDLLPPKNSGHGRTRKPQAEPAASPSR